MTDRLPVTVVLTTRNPDARIVQTVETVLASRYPCLQLCIVDQSDRVLIAQLLGTLLEDARVHVVPCSCRGLAAGRNVGVAWAASSPVIAFTDDDCAVTPTWVSEIVAPFGDDERIGLVFGMVRAAPHDPGVGFIPSYHRDRPFLARSIRDKHRLEGMGASMAIRRAVWVALHGFDECLGAGARLKSAEETDFAVRALQAGVWAYETPGAIAIHAGLRMWPDAPRVLGGYLYGIGAMIAKHLKLGRWGITAVAARLAWRWTSSKPVIDLGAELHRRARLFGFLSGVVAGLRLPVDRTTGMFEAPARDERLVDAGEPEPGHRLTKQTHARRAVVAVIADRTPARLASSASPPTAERVSIVVPSWNVLPFLDRALTSLVSRTTYPYELIIVDNGSTDGSKAFIRRFIEDHPQIDCTFIDNAENRYFSEACNQGFLAASPDSKYLAVYCNDVEATGDRWLDALVDAVQPAGVVAAGHTGVETITERQRGVFLSYDPDYGDPALTRRMHETITQPDGAYTHIYGYCFLLKRSLLQHTGLYLHTGPFAMDHSDWEWCLRFAAMDYQIANVAVDVHHWNSISDLFASHPAEYRALVQRLDDPVALARYLDEGRPLFECEAGFRVRYGTPLARTMERVKRRLGFAVAPE